MIKTRAPIVIAISIGLITLFGLIFSLPAVNQITLAWGTTLAAFALLLGVINLLIVHAKRLLLERNIYSGILVISMMLVFVLAITDRMGLTNEGVQTVFNLVQVPLETALASLLAFFLLFALFHLLRRQQTGWSILFVVTVLLALLSSLLTSLTVVPAVVSNSVAQVWSLLQSTVVSSGIRGLLIGVALGTMLLAIRLLIGMERPYNK